MNADSPRWTGRHTDKDRLRHAVWSALEAHGAATGDPWYAIPDFNGAAAAASMLTQLPAWQQARVIKCNPDSAQAPLRLAALNAGKRVYTPVPELVNDYPYLCLDPVALATRGIAFTRVMHSNGAAKFGKPCLFADVEPIDFFVVGCVAVTPSGGRTGKGAGFADLELGIFNHYGLVSPDTPFATTVHDLQVVADEAVIMQAHDAPLDWIATPTRLIETRTRMRRPGAINWDDVRPDQFDAIPFLAGLRESIQGSGS